MQVNLLVILWIEQSKRRSVFNDPDLVTIHGGNKHLFLFGKRVFDVVVPVNKLIPDFKQACKTYFAGQVCCRNNWLTAGKLSPSVFE